MPDAWPALMRRETAAAYCDMTPEQFDRQCPVAPVDQGWRGLRWKRAKLDAWIDNLPEKPRARKIGLDCAETTPANEQGCGTQESEPDEAPPMTPEERRRASLARIG